MTSITKSFLLFLFLTRSRGSSQTVHSFILLLQHNKRFLSSLQADKIFFSVVHTQKEIERGWSQVRSWTISQSLTEQLIRGPCHICETGITNYYCGDASLWDLFDGSLCAFNPPLPAAPNWKHAMELNWGEDHHAALLMMMPLHLTMVCSYHCFQILLYDIVDFLYDFWPIVLFTKNYYLRLKRELW